MARLNLDEVYTTGDAGTKLKALDTGGQVFNVRAYDVKGDGSNDDTTPINTLFSQIDAGSTLYFPAGDYMITGQVGWSSKELHVVFADGARLVEAEAIGITMLRNTSGHGSRVVGARVVGIEDEDSYDGADSTRYAIAFVGVNDGIIQNAVISGKSKGIGLLNSCEDVRVIQPTISGFFTEEPGSGKNYHQGVTIISGSGSRVEGLIARNIGSAVLLGTTPENVEIIGGRVTNFWDNGVYISSGDKCKVIGFAAKNGGAGSSSGVKVRGNGHLVSGCSTYNTPVGITVTGNLAVADSYGNNGYGTVVSGNTIEQTSQYGVFLDDQDGFYARHVKVTGNTLINTATNGGAFAAIGGWADHSDIEGNIIEGCGGATVAAVFMTWTAPGGSGAASTGTGLRVRNNIITGSASDGIRVSNATGCEISGNVGTDLAGGDLVDARNLTAAEIRDNRAEDEGDFVVRTDANCASCRIINNKGDRGSGNGRSHVIGGTGHYVVMRDRGTPEGFIAAAVGSTATALTGGASTTLYVKESGDGNTGWVAK